MVKLHASHRRLHAGIGTSMYFGMHFIQLKLQILLSGNDRIALNLPPMRIRWTFVAWLNSKIEDKDRDRDGDGLCMQQFYMIINLLICTTILLILYHYYAHVIVVLNLEIDFRIKRGKIEYQLGIYLVFE